MGLPESNRSRAQRQRLRSVIERISFVSDFPYNQEEEFALVDGETTSYLLMEEGWGRTRGRDEAAKDAIVFSYLNLDLDLSLGERKTWGRPWLQLLPLDIYKFGVGVAVEGDVRPP